jgi:hypothetical protein
MPQGRRETGHERRPAAHGLDTGEESGPARVGRHTATHTTFSARSARPRIAANVDTTESGPSRLHITPGRPREIEVGLSRKGQFAAKGGRTTASGQARIATGAEARESGPARIGQFAPATARVTAGADARHVGADTKEAGPARVGRYRK